MAANGTVSGDVVPLRASDLARYRFLFFTGKGGVGKTSVSCAVATALADTGRRVLVVTTDPASNLGDVFCQVVGTEPTAVMGAPRLFAEEVDPVKAAAEYRERVVGPYRGVLPDDAIASMEEQLSGSCTVEIAAFDRFASLLGDEATLDAYDNVVFDTAPTGHTLRLLELPSAWTSYLDHNSTGTSCLGQLSGLGGRRALYRTAMDRLRDPELTGLVFVSLPEGLALAEAARSASELRALGIEPRMLVVNGWLARPSDDLSRSMAESQARALESLPAELARVPRRFVPLRDFEVSGLQHLRVLLDAEGRHVPGEVGAVGGGAVWQEGDVAVGLAGMDDLVDDLARRDVRVVLAMGKGGVGKTTVAVRIARGLVERGRRVLLTTTDPADHLGAFDLSGLRVSHIDEHEELEQYREEVLSKARKSLSVDDLAYVEEDLRSPCTREIATFRAFAEIVAHADDEVVVVDTAPTGHTLLLLGSAQSNARQMEHSGGDVPASMLELLPRLRNPRQSQTVVVTLPEATPVREASRLVEDLDRASIPHDWWVVNRCLSGSRTSDPVLGARAAAQGAWIREVVRLSHERAVGIDWDPASRGVTGRKPRQGAPADSPAFEGASAGVGAADAHGGPDGVSVVAFVCTRNSCRSQMAEALAREVIPGAAQFCSAGTNPADEVDAGALAELRRRGVSARGLRPKGLSELPRHVDWLITMGCGVSCPSVPCDHRDDWGLEDPTGGSQGDYAACADAIERRLVELRGALGGRR